MKSYNVLFFIAGAYVASAQCPQPTISGLQTLCLGQPITLTASGGYSAYAWSNGANTQSTTISVPGSYVVTVTCSNGSTAIGFVNVQGFNTGVAPAAIPPGVNICLGQCSNINVLVNNGGNTGPFTLTLNRSTGGQEVITFNCNCQIFTFSLCPTETTTYTFVSLVNSQGCEAFVNPVLTSFTITVLNSPLTVNGPASLCPGQTGTLTVTPGNVNNYTWSNGATGNNITINGPGTYSVTATFNGTCTSAGTITVAGENLPPPTITGGTSLCINSSLTLTATGANYTSYLWSNGETTPGITINQPGTYTVTVSDNAGCTASASTSIVERPLPTVTLSVANPEVCAGACTTVTTNFTGTAPFTLTYTTSNGGSATQTFFSNTGTFDVCIPANAPAGGVTVQATALTDTFCTCD